ncbi:MAG: phage portal protein [Oscillospiraceae bacterium]|nr:phage portal protein [Oscillospiraceae bacterium]
MSKQRGVEARIIKASAPVEKAETSTEIYAYSESDAGGFMSPPTDLRGYKRLVNHSSILPQCIKAYKSNIAGFGIGVRYKDDLPETPERRAEWDKMSEVLQFLSIDQATKEVFEDVIEARETYGIAYLEVIRNLAGEVIGVEFIDNIPSVQKTAPLSPYVEVEYEMSGKTAKRQKKFCKYRQQLNGKTVYFKEIGDPRIMDNRTGDYGESVPIEYQANELLEFAIGTEPYGEVRWIGTVLNVDGSRKAESLNNRYFSEGRHTPLMILINGGTLTDDSFAKLQGYMNDIKGENGQHAFIVLEAENLDSRTDMDVDAKPNLEVVKMADVLQKDELFQDYLDNNRRKVQSAFQLPDLYVGYTTDFNRATAQSAQEVTEEQVFQPERESLAWVINHKLLADYHFKYVEAYFLDPDISNPDDLYKILTVCNNAGGLTPNKAKSILYEAMGETAENYEGDWGDVPLAYASKVQSAPASTGFDQQISQQIQKSVENNDVEITAVLKEIRTLLRKNYQKGASKSGNRAIIKDWDESLHPRDENGRFAGGFGGASSSDFANAVADAKATVDAKNAWRVTAHTEEELNEDYPGAALHITSGGSTVAVTSDGDIISVCGNSSDTIRGRELMKLATENGGTKLDSYSGNHGFYVKCGFEPVSWCKWDDQYAPDGWDASRDNREPIVFYKYTGNTGPHSAESLNVNNFLASTPASADYDAAQAARDSKM